MWMNGQPFFCLSTLISRNVIYYPLKKHQYEKCRKALGWITVYLLFCNFPCFQMDIIKDIPEFLLPLRFICFAVQ